MFFAWSFFGAYIFFFGFGIALSSTVRAGLAFYSRAHGGHAHSLRWAQQVGFFELLKVVKQSYDMKLSNRKSVFSISLVFFFLPLLAPALDLGAKSFIKESLQGINPSQVLTKTSQYIVYSIGDSRELVDWSTPLLYNSNTEDALTMLFNRTRNIPDYEQGLMYTPKKYPYEVGCDVVDFSTGTLNAKDFPSWSVFHNGCAVLTVAYSGDFDYDYTLSEPVQHHGSDGSRARIVVPGTIMVTGIPLINSGLISTEILPITAISQGDGFVCAVALPDANVFFYNFTGLISAPKTIATKCLQATGKAISISTSYITFAVPCLECYANVTKNIFKDDSNELVQAMQTSIDDGTLTNFSSNISSSILVMEVKITKGPTANIMACISRRNLPAGIPGNDGLLATYLICTYTSVSAVISKPQPMLPEIVALRNAGGVVKPFPAQANGSLTVQIDHVSQSSATKDSGYYTPGIIEASSITANYLADLGQNFFIDWMDSSVYIVFDTVVLMQGYEIPGWLFCSAIGAMAFGILFWIFAQVVLDYRFKGSLHWAISAKLFGPKNAPRLMRFLPETVEFEDVPVMKPREGLLDTNSERENKNMDLKAEYQELVEEGDEGVQLFEIAGGGHGHLHASRHLAARQLCRQCLTSLSDCDCVVNNE